LIITLCPVFWTDELLSKPRHPTRFFKQMRQRRNILARHQQSQCGLGNPQELRPQWTQWLGDFKQQSNPPGQPGTVQALGPLSYSRVRFNVHVSRIHIIYRPV
jgi:hypothetical protein